MKRDKTSVAPFLKHAKAIRASDPSLQPAVSHDAGRWKRGLESSRSATMALQECLEFLQNTLTLTREVLFRATAENISPQARFLMQMIWGYLPDDGRARGRVLAYYNTPTISHPKEYRKVVEDIHEGELEKAFRSLCEVKGMSTSFASKVLYFESRRLPSKVVPVCPVIMDDKVAGNLVRLTSPLAYSCVTVSAPRPVKEKGTLRQFDSAWRKYWNYLKLCHAIADTLDVEADAVEYFLFSFEALERNVGLRVMGSTPTAVYTVEK